jgi:thiol-disulfide isomerase/thioredoxin
VPEETQQEPAGDTAAARPWWDRWRPGMLTVLAAVVIVGGVLLLDGGDSGGPEADQAGMSLPPLPASARGEGAAPDFSVDLFDGSRFILGRHLRDDGRPIILNLWASWCFPCREEMPDLDAAAADNPSVLILGIAVDDDPESAEEFATEIAVSYPLGADADGRVSRAYPAPGLPATFVIGSDGVIRNVVFGRLTVTQIEELVDLATQG